MSYAKRNNKPQMIDLFIKHGAPAPINDAKKKPVKGVEVAPPKVNERKVKKPYILTVLRDGVYEPMSEEEFRKFKEDHPDLAKYFDSTEPDITDNLDIPEIAESAPIYDCWDKAAKRLITVLYKVPNAFIFHEPVDPVKLNIPDYLDIIKQPMDFSTIKQKLSNNQYLRL